MELRGEADLSTRRILRAGLDAVQDVDQVRVIVDVSGLRFCEVHSAQMILDLAQSGRMVLVGPGSSVERVLELLDPFEVVPRFRRMCDATAVHSASDRVRPRRLGGSSDQAISAESGTEGHALGCRIIAVTRMSEAAERLHRLLKLIDAEPPAGDGDTLAGRLDRICRATVRILPADGAGVTVMDSDAHPLGTMAASSPVFRGLEEVQFTLGEGPCVEASATRSPVLEANLARAGRRRWPAYADAAQQQGVNAVFAFPLQVGAARLGVLDVYRFRDDALSPESVLDALGLARICLTTMLRMPTIAVVGEIGDGIGEALRLSPEVYQAQGIVMMQLEVSLAEAMVRLRAYSYGHSRPIGEVAAEVLAGTIVFTREDP